MNRLKSVKFALDLVICVFAKCADLKLCQESTSATRFYPKQAHEVFTEPDFALELSATLRAFGLNAIVVDDYPYEKTSQNILLVDASFEEEIFGDVDFSFPVLKILKSYPDFKKINFHDFIVHPFSDIELICRIINLYNMYKNIQHIHQVNNNFKSYLLNLSHDVYSPIKLIKNQIEYLRIHNENEDHNQIFESTLSQLSNIINILLSVPYSSVASDKIAIEDNIQTVNFALLIQNIATQLGLYASAQGVDITVHIQNQAKNACIVSNYTYLWRMVYNLVFNAIKYCLGSGLIKLSLLKVDGVLRFEVRDTGIGMTPEQLTDIRQYFALSHQTSSEGELGSQCRAEVSGVEATGGFGRGLVVVKLVVNSLKATATVDSELGVGTTFIIDYKEC